MIYNVVEGNEMNCDYCGEAIGYDYGDVLLVADGTMYDVHEGCLRFFLSDKELGVCPLCDDAYSLDDVVTDDGCHLDCQEDYETHRKSEKP